MIDGQVERSPKPDAGWLVMKSFVASRYTMSIAVNALGLIIGAGSGLSPVLAAMLHNASSVAPVANSSRLIRYELS